MKKIYYMLILAGILVIAGILATPAHARSPNAQELGFCEKAANVSIIIVNSRDKGMSLKRIKEVTDEKLTDAGPGELGWYHAIADRVYANPDQTPAYTAMRTFQLCAESAQELLDKGSI